jgi:hypothetical protein
MLIGIYSPAAGSGKSSVADHLVTQHGFTHLSFAEPLKSMISSLLYDFGYSPQDAHHATHVAKTAPLPEIDDNVDARHLLRTLGTEWGRSCVHPDIWLRCWTSRYMRLQLQGIERVVVDDMRFLNEAALLDRFGAHLWKVTRPGTERNTDHASEGGLDHLHALTDPENDCSLAFHHIIENDESLDALYSQVDDVLAFDYFSEVI